MAKQVIRIGHSPDPDDAFMFHAMTHETIDCGPYEFRHQLEDIETLNRRALAGELEISAVSIHAYTKLTERYLLMPSGASMGDRYGPMIVAREPLTRADLRTRRIAVPGTLTSAFLAAQLWMDGPFEHVVTPFDRIMDEVEAGRVDAGLIIHEGQLTYGRQGLKLIVDLGVWWHEETGGLPLPLGGNVIRRDLGPKVIADCCRLLRESIQHALADRKPALRYAMKYGRGLDEELADRFVGMYVNDWTLDYGPKGREAIRLFLERGVALGVVPGPIRVDFAEG
jgi:1,4-dihydroxy-6-naphthoate synthase